MQRLNGADTFFLVTEGTNWHMHTGALVLLDTAHAEGFSFERLRDITAERLNLVPKFKCRLQEVPLGIDNPVWVDDERFDIDYHFRRVGVPSPGGVHELCGLVGELISMRLDRRRPLWEIWFVDGLAGNRAALLIKTHHAVFDGVSGVSLAQVMCDIDANPPAAPPPELPPRPESPPSGLGLFARGLLSLAQTPLRIGEYGLQMAAQGYELARSQWSEDPPRNPLTPAPGTPFNGPISGFRRFAYTSLPLAEVMGLRRHFGVKANDVILALTASAVRRYLLECRALPKDSLVAAVPFSIRTAEEEGELNNRAVNMCVPISTELRDPVRRLRAIHHAANRAKNFTRALQEKTRMDFSDALPPMISGLAWNLFAPVAERESLAPVNLVISNIVGPAMPVYVAGARIEAILPASALMIGMGINVTVLSYLDRIHFGIVVDRSLVQDPWRVVDGIPLALDELRAAAARRPGRRGRQLG